MPTIDTSSPSRNRTPQSTAISPQIDASQLRAVEECGEVIQRGYMHVHIMHSH